MVSFKNPVAIDLFACEGGATIGYQRAGFEVYAVDMERKYGNRNPATGFHLGDALQVLRDLRDGVPVEFKLLDGTSRFLTKADVTLLHLSPPCQGYTRGNAGKVTKWPKLIPDVRALAEEIGLPYVIENVKDAAPEMHDPIGLCGCMFDLSAVDTDGIKIHLQRLRLFETNWSIEAPRPHDHSSHEWVAGSYGGARRDKYEARYVRKGGYVPKEKRVVQELLGFPSDHKMTWMGLYESLPPAYTEYIGRKMLDNLVN